MSAAEKTENWPGRRIAFKSFAADLARRRAELGITDADLPRNSGARRTASADEAGNFRFLLLPPGVYSIEVSRTGFKKFRREGIVGLKHHGDGAWSVDLGEGGVHRIGRTYLHDVKAIMHA